MKDRLIINPAGLSYIPKRWRDQGYRGEVDALPNACTITLIKPETPLEEVKRSLENTLRDVKQQIRLEVSNASGS